jgi:beta-lactamase class D
VKTETGDADGPLVGILRTDEVGYFYADTVDINEMADMTHAQAATENELG